MCFSSEDIGIEANSMDDKYVNYKPDFQKDWKTSNTSLGIQ